MPSLIERAVQLHGLDRVREVLSEDELAELKWIWRAWARPNQLPPPGDWLIWLMLTGRGFGKTRAGAEFIRAEVESGRARRIALVARTPADGRDIMIEGESGILSVCPPNDRPMYEPTKRRLTWPNGAIATMYTSWEPDMLRGPQHDLAWCDELACLVPGTMIATTAGPMPIEQVREGDTVFTRRGEMPVLAAWQSASRADLYELTLSTGQSLYGTGNHRVWVCERGWVPLCAVRPFDTMLTWDMSSNGAVSAGTKRVPGVITSIAADACCTVRSTSLFTDQSQRTSSFITSTATARTTPSRILRRSPKANIFASMGRGVPPLGILNAGERIAGMRGRGGSLDKDAVCTAALSSRTCRLDLPSIASLPIEWLITGVPDSMCRRHDRRSHARAESSHVLYVAPSSGDPTREPRRAVETAGMPYVVRIGPVKGRKPVYNLTVAGPAEYFANGVLVHNSFKYPRETWDNLMFGLRLGLHPRCVVTTTPRPISVIKEIMGANTSAIVRGSTHENLKNLAPSFRDQIIARYEGTSLGRQELYGEVLDEIPGAIFKRSWITIKEPPKDAEGRPDFVKLVVAVDPASGTSEDSDETGIIGAAVGADGNGYIIADVSARVTPDLWAKRAVAAYHRLSADKVLGESNFGGEMVRLTIKTADPNVPVKLVTASRGKRVRAEPIAALYEQGRVFHTQEFPQLTDQMCTWTPESGISPDRLDALVWALTELLVGNTASFEQAIRF